VDKKKIPAIAQAPEEFLFKSKENIPSSEVVEDFRGKDKVEDALQLIPNNVKLLKSYSIAVHLKPRSGSLKSCLGDVDAKDLLSSLQEEFGEDPFACADFKDGMNILGDDLKGLPVLFLLIGAFGVIPGVAFSTVQSFEMGLVEEPREEGK